MLISALAEFVWLNPLPVFKDNSGFIGKLSFEIGVAPKSGLEGIHDHFSFLGRYEVSLYRAFRVFPDPLGHRLDIVFDIGKDIRNGVSLEFLDKIEFAVLVDPYAYDVRVAE